jgi:ketosteroid isomerase-like protein
MASSSERRRGGAALAVGLAIVLMALGGCASVPDRLGSERYIIESERAWAASVASGDASVLERILADDFVGIDPEGRAYGKTQMIAETKQAPRYFLSNRLNQAKVRFFGDAAVAQGDESWVRRSGEPKCGRFVWTDTWIRRHAKWQIVAAEDLTVAESCGS